MLKMSLVALFYQELNRRGEGERGGWGEVLPFPIPIASNRKPISIRVRNGGPRMELLLVSLFFIILVNFGYVYIINLKGYKLKILLLMIWLTPSQFMACMIVKECYSRKWTSCWYPSDNLFDYRQTYQHIHTKKNNPILQ